MGYNSAAQFKFNINATWGFRKAILTRASIILSK